MNTTKGIRILTSGNQFHWKHMRLSNRGSVQGSFSREPSDADTEEGFRFLASLVPKHARQITTRSSRSQGEQMRDAFLFGGSQNQMPRTRLTKEQQTMVLAEKWAAEWWRTEGTYIDPDTEDVDWYDKRSELAQMAYIAGFKQGAGRRAAAGKSGDEE